MRPANPLHNPFSNRFNEPCKRRADEMQSAEHMAWLKERDVFNDSNRRSADATLVQRSNGWIKTIAAFFGLLALIVTVGVFVTSN